MYKPAENAVAVRNSSVVEDAIAINRARQHEKAVMDLA